MPQTADNLLSDPEIATAYEDVRSDKSATTWMVLKYISGTSDALKLDSTGEGDIAEMVEHLGDDEAAYAFVRMTVGNDELSQRIKFVFVSWCGEFISFRSVDRSQLLQGGGLGYNQMRLLSCLWAPQLHPKPERPEASQVGAISGTKTNASIF